MGLDNTQKNNFYDSLINFVRKLGEEEMVVIATDSMVISAFLIHVGMQQLLTYIEKQHYHVSKKLPTPALCSNQILK